MTRIRTMSEDDWTEIMESVVFILALVFTFVGFYLGLQIAEMLVGS